MDKMTREEASFILANIDRRVCDDELNEALDMAIKALEVKPVLDKIRAEIDTQEKWLSQAGYSAYNTDIAFSAIKRAIVESEDRE